MTHLFGKLIGLHVAQLAIVFLFCFGYFPRKPILNEISRRTSISAETAVFDKLVIVMIDALRSDFLYYNQSSNFHNVHNLINHGKGIGFTAFANPPTVTLPRLKGILTGSTPIFLDAILNVAEGDDSSNLKEHDSILKQFSLASKKINFYGDDTWLKLFGHEMFNDYEGTSSFFVKDFTEVDNNVTRHIDRNMQQKENWDVLILHYLGLDHIGHAMGSSPPEMAAKQLELDGIIKKVYDSTDDDTLLLVLGDHGMTDSGNHGGSSKSETSAGLCFLSKKFNLQTEKVSLPITEKSEDYSYLAQAQQVDLVPTLMSLFNLPIPKNSVGVLIEDVLYPFFSEPEMQVLRNQNQQQLTDLLGENEELIGSKNTTEGMKVIQSKLMDSATNYNYTVLYTSIAAMGLLFLVNLFVTFEMSVGYFLVLILSLILGISSFATSFIEEEHKVWYWLLIFIVFATSFVFRTINLNSTLSTVALLVLIRLLKSWNNSGQKFFYYDLISNFLQNNQSLCWMLNLLSMLFVTKIYNSDSSLLSNMVHILLALTLFLYKVSWEMKNSDLDWSFLASLHLIFNSEELISVARSIFKVCALSLAVNKFRKPKNKNLQIATITFILMLQSSFLNIPMFSCFIGIEYFIEKLDLNTEISLVLEILLEYLSFFSFGNTNSISTIDLINAYNGVSATYDIKIVGFLMMLSTFAPSIFFSLKQSSRNYTLTLKYSLILNSLWGFLFLLSCFIGRYHLFVWSVFSPKLCYFLAWNVFMNVVVKIALPLILFSTPADTF